MSGEVRIGQVGEHVFFTRRKGPLSAGPEKFRLKDAEETDRRLGAHVLLSGKVRRGLKGPEGIVVVGSATPSVGTVTKRGHL